jgi:hypothetical protein
MCVPVGLCACKGTCGRSVCAWRHRPGARWGNGDTGGANARSGSCSAHRGQEGRRNGAAAACNNLGRRRLRGSGFVLVGLHLGSPVVGGEHVLHAAQEAEACVQQRRGDVPRRDGPHRTHQRHLCRAPDAGPRLRRRCNEWTVRQQFQRLVRQLQRPRDCLAPPLTGSVNVNGGHATCDGIQHERPRQGCAPDVGVTRLHHHESQQGV